MRLEYRDCLSWTKSWDNDLTVWIKLIKAIVGTITNVKSIKNQSNYDTTPAKNIDDVDIEISDYVDTHTAKKANHKHEYSPLRKIHSETVKSTEVLTEKKISNKKAQPIKAYGYMPNSHSKTPNRTSQNHSNSRIERKTPIKHHLTLSKQLSKDKVKRLPCEILKMSVESNAAYSSPLKSQKRQSSYKSKPISDSIQINPINASNTIDSITDSNSNHKTYDQCFISNALDEIITPMNNSKHTYSGFEDYYSKLNYDFHAYQTSEESEEEETVYEQKVSKMKPYQKSDSNMLYAFLDVRKCQKPSNMVSTSRSSFQPRQVNGFQSKLKQFEGKLSTEARPVSKTTHLSNSDYERIAELKNQRLHCQQ